MCCTDIFLDWKQNADEVIVRLRCGEGALKLENVDSAFSDTACQVRFPGKLNMQSYVPSYFTEFKTRASMLIPILVISFICALVYCVAV